MKKIFREHTDYLKRKIETSESPHEVIIVQGARQVGKTTLIKEVLNTFEAVLSFNLEEDLLLRNDIDMSKDFSDFETLMRLKGLDVSTEQILFIDEAQESEALGSYVRFMKEKWPLTKVILSGSSMSRLFRDTQRVPVGRVSALKLNPLSFYEFLDCLNLAPLQELLLNFTEKKNISPLLHSKLLEKVDEYMEVGGLPEVVLAYAANKDFKDVRRSIYLFQEEDFIRKTSFEDKDLFSAAMTGVANHLGSPAKYTHISPSSREAKKIFNVMKAWHLLDEVEQKGLASTTSFLPKRYCYDLGIAQHARNMPFPTLSILNTIDSALRTQLGGLFENLVFLSLTNYHMGQADISSWKESSQNQTEVDFVWRHIAPIPIECKATLRTTARHYANLRKYLLKTNLKVGFLVTAAPFEILKEEQYTLINLPIYLCRIEIIEKLFMEHST